MDVPSSLSPAQRAWLLDDEALWRRAHELAAARPELDVTGIYHVLRNLRKTPAERLRAALDHGRKLFRPRPR